MFASDGRVPGSPCGHLVSYLCVCVCVCVCVYGGLSSFCIWVEGLCVVVWWGEKHKIYKMPGYAVILEKVPGLSAVAKASIRKYVAEKQMGIHDVIVNAMVPQRPQRVMGRSHKHTCTAHNDKCRAFI